MFLLRCNGLPNSTYHLVCSQILPPLKPPLFLWGSSNELHVNSDTMIARHAIFSLEAEACVSGDRAQVKHRSFSI